MGWNASCARKTDGSVWCWGLNSNGQVGDNSYTDRLGPAQLTSLSGSLSVACGRDHCCAAKADGTVACWGLDDQGQLGNGVQQIVRPVGVRMTCD